MTKRTDLSRWNRAGLTKFTYIDGNAVEYLEFLRQQLAAQFADPDSKLCEWLNPPEEVPANEASSGNEILVERDARLSLRQKRIVETYRQDRRDWAWEISRSFARCCHTLTGYADAYANEGFLGTATQWDNVRRLVEMLDYHPAPPASASTPLVITAKGEQPGTLAQGFQVKNSPPTGGDKVIFETLQDLVVDPALNELRPAGWDQPQGPALPDGGGATGGGGRFSEIADGPVIGLQGVGGIWSKQLNSRADKAGFRIRDFVELDPGDSADLDIGVTRLRELKAMATTITYFELDGDWSAVLDWPLPKIAGEDPQTLAKTCGNTLAEAKKLQQQLEMIGACLDQAVYQNNMLRDLLPPDSAGGPPAGIETLWKATSKPKPLAGQVVMIQRASTDEAEAAEIMALNESTGMIELASNPLQSEWPGWPKSEAVMQVSPRWKRDCWLNGSEVVRTQEPHGLSKDAYIGWRLNNEWTFAKVTEADKRNLWLEADQALPVDGDDLYQLLPISGEVFPAKYEALELLGDSLPLEIEDVSPLSEVPSDVDVSKPRAEDIFTLKEVHCVTAAGAGSGGGGGGGGGGLLPPASLPKIGSFLFPSPMLPLDLVKIAVELMLSIGVMAIPSTGDIVIKGMPFGGMLEDAASEADAAAMLFDMLDEIEATVQPCDGDENLFYQRLDGTLATYSPGDSTDGFVVDSETEEPVLAVPVEEKLVIWSDDIEADPAGGLPTVEDAIKAELTKLLSVPDDREETTLFQKIKDYADERGPLLAMPDEKNRVLKGTVEISEPRYLFDGTPDRIERDDWVVGKFADGLRAIKINSIDTFIDAEKNETFAIDFDGSGAIDSGLERISTDFRGRLDAEGADVNNAPLDAETIELEQEPPQSLTVGREVLVAGCGDPVLCKISDIEGSFIKIEPPLSGCTLGQLKIYGNVVNAGHGESKPARILGSGNAAKSNQSFTLEVEQIAFTPDATMSAGVAAAIVVEVDGRIWQQVSTLKDSVADDHHFAIRMTEEGYVKILFGDGQNGRRLPSGKNNVRVSYRVGSGTDGNLPAASLEKPVNKQPLVEAVSQPLLSSGGGDMEDLASLRENAPPTLLALERAVSLSDFSHLAAAQSSIWQAQAYSQVLQGGRLQGVRVVIVPAGGARSESVESDVQNFLQRHAMPGVKVKVVHFDPRRFDLAITVRVDLQAFVAAEVQAAVEAAVNSHFALKNRKLGAHLYISEVYKVVEAVVGVENSICVLDEDKKLKVIEAPDDSSVVYLDIAAPENPSTLVVSVEEYQP